ncbi:glycosyltransferase family A protein [Lentisphaera profundi]|uniref:Glycosyltransferase family A protein n=1 Tax=Lentisphaera profundi TaxID=1658616 RepID=A0ABY7VQG3_9BACT|nr:glycosyltransferase family A protein [Lentisphaera profundi]WDE95959.1 glycosyltransferase family A protein [Lentisphaera profundi]
MPSYAPIVIFVYNRVNHTRQTIDALKMNIEAPLSDLIIFSDAPKNDDQVEEVQNVRKYIKTINSFKSIKIIEQKKNLGLAESIISGVSKVVNEYGKVIVLEDDMVTSPFFLKYMNEGLERYQSDDAVASINAYMYPVKETLPEAFFLQMSDCWGWATWRESWELFERDGANLLEKLTKDHLGNSFDLDGNFRYTQMLEEQISGHVNSWAIRWYASTFLHNKLGLYPGISLVHNIGVDGTGVHCPSLAEFDVSLRKEPISYFPRELQEDAYARGIVAKHLGGYSSFTSRLKRFVLSKFTPTAKNKI